MSLKEEVYRHFQNRLKEKINHLQQTLNELSQSAANETKSTAGDKHETALTMLQIEQENKRKQLSELYIQQQLMDKIDPAIVAPHILNGSLVHTDKGYFFISIAMGKTLIDKKIIFALSPSSPLGQELIGHQANDKVEVNKNSYTILSIE
jgi:transcription elongation GreA/GreB family factor